MRLLELIAGDCRCANARRRSGDCRCADAGRRATCCLVMAMFADLFSAGCNGPQRQLITGTALRTYWPSELAVGDTARSFAFTTATGELKRLAEVRGRVTVLAFADEANWPTCAALELLANLARRESVYNVEVVAIVVGQPAGSCDEALAAAAECELPPEHTVLVCDPYGGVRRLFGEGSAGRYYVLDNFLRIKAIGELSDIEDLRAAIRRIVDEIYDLDRRMGAFDDDWGRD